MASSLCIPSISSLNTLARNDIFCTKNSPRNCCFPQLNSHSLRLTNLPNSTNKRPYILRSVSDPNSSGQELDIKLPRRSLLVMFNCDACGTRTKRLVNRSAYERGTVFVQCAGCEAYHKLVDNLGLIVEYDFRKEEENS